jgi:N-acetylglucosamine malate deacetylase 1
MMKRLMSLFTVVSLSVTIASLPSTGARAQEQASKKLKIVVFSAQPADAESGVGGLIANLTQQGHEVIIAVATAFRGDRCVFGQLEFGPRSAEEVAACKLLGATSKILTYDHNTFVSDLETQKVVKSWLEEMKPDIVITHWPIDTHPNHAAAYSLVWNCYQQRTGGWNLYLYEVETGAETLAFKPDLYIDIGPVRSLKKQVIDIYQSQNPVKIWGYNEPMQHTRGAECGVKDAEAYVLVEAKQGCPLLPVKFLPRINADGSKAQPR